MFSRLIECSHGFRICKTSRKLNLNRDLGVGVEVEAEAEVPSIVGDLVLDLLIPPDGGKIPTLGVQNPRNRFVRIQILGEKDIVFQAQMILKLRVKKVGKIRTKHLICIAPGWCRPSGINYVRAPKFNQTTCGPVRRKVLLL